MSSDYNFLSVAMFAAQATQCLFGVGACVCTHEIISNHTQERKIAVPHLEQSRLSEGVYEHAWDLPIAFINRNKKKNYV